MQFKKSTKDPDTDLECRLATVQKKKKLKLDEPVYFHLKKLFYIFFCPQNFFAFRVWGGKSEEKNVGKKSPSSAICETVDGYVETVRICMQYVEKNPKGN